MTQQETVADVVKEMRAAAPGLEHGPGAGLAILGYADRLAALSASRASVGEVERLALLEQTAAKAYGYLWKVQDLPESGSRKARHLLRDVLTHEQRGDGITAAFPPADNA